MDKTAWNNEDICSHIVNANFPPLPYSDHFPSLNFCIKQISSSCKKIIDLGCCSAEFASAFPQFDYCGADLPHIIENVSKIKNPNVDYISFDATKDDFDFCKHFDIVLMNAFISELPDPLPILEKILQKSTGYILIHRQDVTNLPEQNGHKEEVYPTYGDLDTINTTLNEENFMDVVERNNFSIKVNIPSFPGSEIRKTILMKKND